MDKTLFNELQESIKQAGAIKRGTRQPARVFRFEVSANDVRDIRNKTGLSQADFAALLKISPRTLQNWEQDRREPTGAAAALLILVKAMPDVALNVLSHK